MRRLLLILPFGLWACTPVPDLAAPDLPKGDAPALLPLDQLIGVQEEPPADTDEVDALLDRAAALRARANTLRRDL